MTSEDAVPVDVPIRDESIRLGQFLKLANLVETGADRGPFDPAPYRDLRDPFPAWRRAA